MKQLTPLAEALGIQGLEVIAFVGAGGKTTAIWQLSNELLALSQRVVLAPTSHILEPVLSSDSSLYLATEPDPDRLIDLLERTPRLIAAAGRDQRVDFDVSAEIPPARPFKLGGLPPATIDQLTPYVESATWLIEADGSRRHGLKAPAQHEPPIPSCANAVIVVASLDAIGQPLDETTVHRAEIFAALAGAHLGQPITAEMIASVLVHPHGGLKHIPDGARLGVLLTQRAGEELHSSAETLADQLLQSGPVERVVVASLRPYCLWRVAHRSSNFQLPRSNLQPRVAAIILAAGGSTRFGSQPKQLLDWHGRSFVQIAADTALSAGLHPVIVVVGSHADEVRASLVDRSVVVVDNCEWALGQSTSVRAGVRALPADVAAAVFMPVDQPNLTPEIIRALIDAHTSSARPIVVATVGGKRTTPTLFHNSLFPAILTIEGDRGARDLIDADPDRVAKVEVDPQSVIDVDTVEDYNMAKGQGARGRNNESVTSHSP